MRVDKDIIELIDKTGILCPCITQNYSGPLYPGFVQTCSENFININKIICIKIQMKEDKLFYVNMIYEFGNGCNEHYLADYIDTRKDAEIIFQEIMRIITMR